jgi:hypothetical protein
MTNSVKFVGLDLHKETISIAIADNGRTGEVRYFGTIDNTPKELRSDKKRSSRCPHTGPAAPCR